MAEREISDLGCDLKRGNGRGYGGKQDREEPKKRKVKEDEYDSGTGAEKKRATRKQNRITFETLDKNRTQTN